MTTLRLLERSDGKPNEFSGKYVCVFDPAWFEPGEPYDGGLLIVTPDREKARHFASAQQAIDYWRQAYGTRPDGEPNRPLTAYTVEIMPKAAVGG